MILRYAQDVVAELSGPAQVRASEAPQDRESPNEAELVRGVVARESWAANALYDLLYPTVARSLQRILHHVGPDYEDLVQVTFERILRALPAQGTGGILNLRAWASGVATHVALDALRSRVRERKHFRPEEGSELASLEIAGSPNAERQLEARRRLAVVQEVLASMKHDLAQAVLLHDLVGHDLQESAALTQVTLAAAQSRLVRGRKELLRRVQLRTTRGHK